MTEEFKGRGMTPHNMPLGGYPEDFVQPANLMDVPAIEDLKRSYGVEEIRKLQPGPDFKITAEVSITQEDLMTDMARKGAKQILANELNRAFAEEGIKTHYTPEMLSALASERLRAEQRQKKKARINKRKRK